MNKKKYTIAQILPALNTGGVERGVIEISKALSDNGFNSIVISSGGHMVPQLRRSGTKHYEINVHSKNLCLLVNVLNILCGRLNFAFHFLS